MDFSGLDEQAESSGEGRRKSRCRRRFSSGVGVSHDGVLVRELRLKEDSKGVVVYTIAKEGNAIANSNAIPLL